jgi:PPOX class probable FMN-dependent enzyme
VRDHPPDWRKRIEELLADDDSAPTNRFAQLATVRTDGGPACRTVAFRGFLEEDPANRLLFCTDARSRKVPQLQADRRAELCWYIGTAREQFRLSGPAECVCEGYPDEALQAARLRVWRDLSDGTRAGFFGPQPGDERAPEAEFEPPAEAEELESMMPANFCLLVLEPRRVAHVRLVPGPDRRTLHTRRDDGTWTRRAVNP